MAVSSTPGGAPSFAAPTDEGARPERAEASKVGFYSRALLMGLYFGIVLVKSEVVRWERVNQMFLFREAHMYLVIVTAIVVAGVAMLLLRRAGARSVAGEPLDYRPKPFHRGVILGGVLFGMGWAITGACPGPIYAQIGAGAWPALFTFVGAMVGMYGYAAVRPRLPH